MKKALILICISSPLSGCLIKASSDIFSSSNRGLENKIIITNDNLADKNEN